MIRNSYNNMILSRIEAQFNKVLPYSAFIAIASAIIIFFSDIPSYFAILDLVIGLTFFVLHLGKDKFGIGTKINITILVAMFIGVLSFLDGGFSSAAISLLLIANIVSVMFLEEKNSRNITILTIVIYCALWFYASFSESPLIHIGHTKWIIQIGVFILYLFILHNIVYSIKDYLLESIVRLEFKIKEVYKLASYDQLTGIPNQYKLKKEFVRIDEMGLCGYLILIRVSNIGLINSVYGDEMGDRVLKEIGVRYKKLLLDKEFLARITGNDFFIWLPEGGPFIDSKISLYGESMMENFQLEGLNRKLELDLSYVYHSTVDTMDESFQKARIAMTYLKSVVDKNIIAYSKELEYKILKEERLIELIETSINEKTFTIVYQGKYDWRLEAFTGVEALARLDDHVLGSISPNEFIPLIEKRNLSIEFGEMIIEKIFSEYSLLQEKYGSQVVLSVNISPAHLLSPSFIEYICARMYHWGIPPQAVILEITEELFIKNLERANKKLLALKTLGFKLSLDDFGTGYSSLNYLSKLSIDELKVDKVFIHNIEEASQSFEMLDMIVSLSKIYNLSVVAEGIETEEQMEMVKSIGIDLIQGYLLSKPKSLSSL